MTSPAPGHRPQVTARDVALRDTFPQILPLRGRLIPLKTIQEVRAVVETADAYVVEIPVRSANQAVSLLRSTLPPPDPNQPFHHIRRFAKAPFLPQHLRRAVHPESPEPLEEARDINQDATVHLIILPSTPPVERSTLTSLLSNLTAAPLRLTLIPLVPPNSHAQAEEFSQKYWPCVYNPSAPPSSHSPPPFLLSQAMEQIQEQAGWYLGIAEEAGSQAKRLGRGRGVGVVIVDTDAAAANRTDGIVAVAGDARYWHDDAPTGDANAIDGRPEDHAVMRAISLVAHQHVVSSSPTGSPSDVISIPNSPPIPLERHFLSSASSLIACGNSSSSYLCTNLSVYISHEPCVCCSMGIIHSRFRNVVFRRRMPDTGGLCADVDSGETCPGLGYGLFWRKELNWRCLGWEFKADGEGEEVGRAMFHA